ncbi:hypothetical protein H105_00853 [Trichophyton soudanense CBS 452.61]|uniref:Uncharacterized protein n=1 Tax=Trichophyton soudanense CBS 452.61 TaxID=1215331 RepID=A0A022Y5X3_TRISD|nr:hypothetical protein H105_00853 [Trichophyton soudanense CBS 452.61]EZG10605.1 hypothetical protein H106_00652 [Trichophyton rubrum CBS 735.88]
MLALCASFSIDTNGLKLLMHTYVHWRVDQDLYNGECMPWLDVSVALGRAVITSYLHGECRLQGGKVCHIGRAVRWLFSYREWNTYIYHAAVDVEIEVRIIRAGDRDRTKFI